MELGSVNLATITILRQKWVWHLVTGKYKCSPYHLWQVCVQLIMDQLSFSLNIKGISAVQTLTDWLTQFCYDVGLYSFSVYKVKRKSKHATSLSISLENIPWKNKKGILSGDGGNKDSLSSKNNLHTSYLISIILPACWNCWSSWAKITSY